VFSIFLPFAAFLFFIPPFAPEGSENKLRGSKKTIKKGETKIEHGKSSGVGGRREKKCFWGEGKCLILRRSNHTPHSIASSPTRPPPLRRVIELAEGKIGFFGYRNRTKPVRRVSGAFSVAAAAFFLCSAASLAFVEALSAHIVFSLLTPYARSSAGNS
jgi:hypothetical protein